MRQKSGGSWLEASLGKLFTRSYLEKPFTKTGLEEWFKVKALSSRPSTTKHIYKYVYLYLYIYMRSF
jgi:hypothetical protein